MRKATALLLLVLSASALRVEKQTQVFLANDDDASSNEDLKFLQQAQSTCPAPFQEIEQGGYRFCYYPDLGYDFPSAQKFCQEHNMYIVEPRTKEYNDLIEQIATSRVPAHFTQLAYLGAECKIVEQGGCLDISDWTWISDGTPVTYEMLNYSYSHYLEGPLATRMEHAPHGGTYWQLVPIKPDPEGCPVMCEMGDHWNRPPPPPQTATCVGGEENQVGEYKFCVADEGKSFDEAGQFCAGNNSNLVSPHSVTIDHAIQDLCNGDEFCWINLKCEASDDSCDTSY